MTRPIPHEIKFREDTWDRDIWKYVYQENEYNLPGGFDADDVVVDIGAHTGAFSYLAWTLGSRRIWAYEASPENASLLRRNLQGLEGVHAIHAGVWGEPLPDMLAYTPSVDYRNTGGGTVLDKGGVQVPMISIEEVLRRACHRPEQAGSSKEYVWRVHLLKLDCEGAEWSILSTCKRLYLVDYICGEYHQDPNRTGWLASNLVGLLLRHGFDVNTRPDSLHLGHFWARKRSVRPLVPA